MADILSTGGKPTFDDRIVKLETHTYNPYVNTTFGYSDEIRIPIQQQDLYTLPCESFLYVEGKLKINKPNDVLTVMLGNNCVAFLLDEIRYELNDVEIDRNRNVGITSTLKNYVSLTSDEDKNMENAGWGLKRRDGLIVKNHFNFCVPLKYLLGLCEDYKRMIINARHELILIRSRNDNNTLIGSQMLEPHAILFHMYTQFHKSYYGHSCNRIMDIVALFTVAEFLQFGPLVIIYCSRQNESIKNGTVDVRIEFECKENVPANTTAYCLILHDRVVEYNPLTNVVHKIN